MGKGEGGARGEEGGEGGCCRGRREEANGVFCGGEGWGVGEELRERREEKCIYERWDDLIKGTNQERGIWAMDQ